MTDWIRRYIDAWNSHEPAQLGAFMAEDAVYEDLPAGQTHRGRVAVEGFVATTGHFSKDYRVTVISEQASGDRFAIEWEMAGHNTGEVIGLPATNKPFCIRGVSIGQLDGSGKVKQNTDYWDMVNYLTQIGLMPPAAG